jgi:hypothetical protein
MTIKKRMALTNQFFILLWTRYSCPLGIDKTAHHECQANQSMVFLFRMKKCCAGI